MNHQEAYLAFTATDQVWQDLLEARFGKDAGTMRYTSFGRGAEGSALRAAFDSRTAAHNAWLASYGVAA